MNNTDALQRRLGALASHLMHQSLTAANSVDIETILEAAATLAALSRTEQKEGKR